MARKKSYEYESDSGEEKDLGVTAVEVEVAEDVVDPPETEQPDIREIWESRWAELARVIRGAGVQCDLKFALKTAGDYFEVDILKWFSEDFPAGLASGRFWTQFVDEVERDLTSEASEPDGSPASFGEFLEAVARQVDMVICRQKSVWSVNSPHETVTGIRQATCVPHVLSVLALLLRRYAQWMGEGVGRAGEQIPSPVHDPNWRPSNPGDYPWSMPKSKRRK